MASANFALILSFPFSALSFYAIAPSCQFDGFFEHFAVENRVGHGCFEFHQSIGEDVNGQCGLANEFEILGYPVKPTHEVMVTHPSPFTLHFWPCALRGFLENYTF
jgi:hypothetical protein